MRYNDIIRFDLGRYRYVIRVSDGRFLSGEPRNGVIFQRIESFVRTNSPSVADIARFIGDMAIGAVSAEICDIAQDGGCSFGTFISFDK